MRFVLTLLAAIAIVGAAAPGRAQYMYLDSNGDGVWTSADVMAPNGSPTTVDVWLRTNANRDGSPATCNVEPGVELNMNHYGFNLRAVNGTVLYSGFINRTPFSATIGELNQDGIHYKNGFGNPVPLAPGTYRLATLTINGQTGTPEIEIVDLAAGSADFTGFGTQPCPGNSFDNLYKLIGPNTQGLGDWTDADGLGAAGTESAPEIDPIADQTVDELALLTLTATATDPDGDPITFSLPPGNPPGTSITSGGVFEWTPAEDQGPGVHLVTIAASDGTAADTEPFSVTVQEVNSPPLLTQPSDMTVNEGATGNQQLAAADADIPANSLTFGKVSGPLFLVVSGAGLVTATPSASDIGSHPVTVRVSDGLTQDTKSFTVAVADVNHEPVADAGGPYTAGSSVPITFDGSGSSDPDGDALVYLWGFGDGTTGSGVTTTHAYSVPAIYVVSLTVTDGALGDADVTTAVITGPSNALVFTVGGNKQIRLGSGKPQSCVQIEPIGGSFSITDVDFGSIRMTYGGNSISAVSDKTAAGGDKNQNGIDEITACFAKESLRTLFAGLPTGDYEVVVEGDLVNGGSFAGTVTLRIVGGGGSLAASLSSNPVNPKATLTFATSKPGMVKVQMYDVQGRLIRILMDESSAAVGYHDVTIDGQDANGSRLASGIYYVKVRSSSDGEMVKAITILK